MYHSPITYTSLPRPEQHLSRQAHSYHAQDTPSSTQSPTKGDFSPGSNYAATSLGQSNKISQYLFLLISKFEALDALSHGIHEPSLRPAPLQISRNSSPRRGGTDGPASTTYNAIFSPRRSQSWYKGMLAENMVASGPEDIFISGSIKKSGSGRLKQTQSHYKVSSIRLRDETEQNLATFRESDVGVTIQSRTGGSKPVVKGGRENSVVKERIKFYDGCMEHTSLSGPCPKLHDSNSAHSSPLLATTVPNTNARPSLYHIVVPSTPRLHKPNCTRRNSVQPSSGPSTNGGSKANSISTKGGTPYTPTKLGSTYGSKIPKPFEQNVPYPFLHTPHTNPPTRHISPKTTLPAGKSGEKAIFGHLPFEVSKVPDPIKKDAMRAEVSGRHRKQEAPANRTNQVSSEKRKTNEKFVTRHRVKSLERSGDSTIGRRGSKDQEMKMLRERGVVAKIFESGPWSLSKATGTRIPRPKWRASSYALPSPPLAQCRASDTKSAEASKLVHNPQQMDRTRISSLIQREQVCPSTPTKGFCRGMHDKIKRWQSKVDIKGLCTEEQKDLSTLKNANNSLTLRKSICENPWNREVGKELQKRGLDGQEIQAIVNEFQDIGREIGNDLSRGKWKMVVAPRLGKGGLAARKDGSSDESGDMDMQIIVREAQCGLEEPKPLRLLEMKRMILLCREKPVGGPACKDRNMRVH